MSNKLKFVIVGFGHIGKRHAEMIFRNFNCELVAVIDIKEFSDHELIKKYNCKYFNNIDDLIVSKLDFDLINICTPNGLHLKYSLIGLDQKKHIVIEKPMALSKKDAELIIHKSILANKKVFCVMQNRYSPPSTWLKNIVESNLLGQVFFIKIDCFWNRDERYYKSGGWHGTKDLDGGTLFTQFSHFIDLMYWIFGDVENVKSQFYNFNHKNLTSFEDSGIINFDFLNGTKGVFTFSTSVFNENLESSLTIIAENGSIKLGGQYMDKVEYSNIKNYKMPVLPPTNPGNDYGTYKGSAQNHNFVIENIVDVLTNNKEITTNMMDGLKVVEIIEKFYKSI